MSRSNYFKVILNLSNYYDDHRLTTTIFVGVEIETVEDLQQKISRLLHIENFHLCAGNEFLHPSEDIRIIREGEILCAIPMKSNECTKHQPQSEHKEPLNNEERSSPSSSTHIPTVLTRDEGGNQNSFGISGIQRISPGEPSKNQLSGISPQLEDLREASSSKASSLKDSSLVSDGSEFVTRMKKRTRTANHPTPPPPPPPPPPFFDEQDSFCEEVIERAPSMESMKPRVGDIIAFKGA